ncbi:hypothetical protein IMC64_003741 [Escherichia coli]|nr:hypothetical protein [Escherichia coli]EGL8746500.1 hypothetical protein [Escherichia coli]
MHLNNRARDLLDKYSAGMAQQFGARDTSRYFSLNDPQENALRLALLESVEFLNMITCLDVDQLSGQVISVGSSVLHTGRSENGRFIRQVGVDGNDYSLVETDSCAALRWDLLSVWANAGKDENEFYNLVQAFTTQAFALDMLRIGFNGKSRAKTTDPVANPNGEDVNIGCPELASGLHLPKTARVVAHSEPVKSGNFADPFRPRYAVDVQLLDADGNPDNQTPVYSAVPLPVPMAGNDSGMFQFPPEGTLVEVAFTGGRPDKPFIRQTLPDGTSLPDVKPGEQLQQQREEVSLRVTQAGDWVRQTDQTISETSMVRTVKADTEQRELVSRETTVKATDKTTVLGTATLLAGAIQQVSAGDYSQAVKGNRLASIEGNEETDIAGQQSTKVGGAVAVEVGESLTEKIAALRKSVAAGGQQVMGATVHIGSESINALTMMLDTIDLLAELAQQCANHSHPTVGTPTNAAAFTLTATKAGQTRSKYQNIIA